jgi:hypothetical protein
VYLMNFQIILKHAYFVHIIKYSNFYPIIVAIFFEFLLKLKTFSDPCFQPVSGLVALDFADFPFR